MDEDAPSIALSLGTYAVVRCAGESSFRALWTEPADLGQAAGHAGLAAERPVLFAGELQLGAGMRLCAWTNVTGTYHFPESLVKQSELPEDIFWAFRSTSPVGVASLPLPGGHFLVHAGSVLCSRATKQTCEPHAPCIFSKLAGNSVDMGDLTPHGQVRTAQHQMPNCLSTPSHIKRMCRKDIQLKTAWRPTPECTCPWRQAPSKMPNLRVMRLLQSRSPASLWKMNFLRPAGKKASGGRWQHAYVAKVAKPAQRALNHDTPNASLASYAFAPVSAKEPGAATPLCVLLYGSVI